ncbi:hypothetical protein GCM10011418_39080 [Sphingobacterium alkalisoli]|uniref:hypothetical protein n=1 Tax=Sphingobacterium alkalisoli TaxID=1874115 RepID=UPI00145E383A|nr:hypothetical protein [Sphingobacterium alkalisoli]GGH28421.1 hypothetical protein GCM10011418_39080 [Sphingobacterium alkalisoli]
MGKYSKYPVKLKVLAKDGIPGTSKSISAFDKLVTKNANRAGKKALRQLSKNKLRQWQQQL